MADLLVALTDAVVGSGRHARLGPVSAAVRAHGFLGVAGPNGAGKSTLLAALAGSIPLSAGSRWAGPGSIGVLLQHHDFLPDLPFTVEDVVAFGRLPHAGPGRRLQRGDRAAVTAAIVELGIEPLRRRPYRALSGGERRKVQLARLLAQGADVLLLDEPTANLDPDWQERITELTAVLHQRHQVAVAMVTHDIGRLPACCTDVLLLQRGRPFAAGTPAEVLTSAVLSELYGCVTEVVERGGRRHALARGATS